MGNHRYCCCGCKDCVYEGFSTDVSIVKAVFGCTPLTQEIEWLEDITLTGVTYTAGVHPHSFDYSVDSAGLPDGRTKQSGRLLSSGIITGVIFDYYHNQNLNMEYYLGGRAEGKNIKNYNIAYTSDSAVYPSSTPNLTVQYGILANGDMRLKVVMHKDVHPLDFSWSKRLLFFQASAIVSSPYKSVTLSNELVAGQENIFLNGNGLDTHFAVASGGTIKVTPCDTILSYPDTPI